MFVDNRLNSNTPLSALFLSVTYSGFIFDTVVSGSWFYCNRVLLIGPR